MTNHVYVNIILHLLTIVSYSRTAYITCPMPTEKKTSLAGLDAFLIHSW